MASSKAPSEEGEPPAPSPAPRRFTGVRAAAAAAAAAVAAEPLSESRAIQVSAASPLSTAIPRRFVRQQVPDDILNDPELAEATSVLPSNYDFEIPKTIWRLRQLGATRVALQFPEGLLLFSLSLSDIIRRFVPGVLEVTVLGDVAYGACCVDDSGALACAGAEALVHYGHSCLVPVQKSSIPTVYVFVHIGCDVDHLISTIDLNFYGGEREEGSEVEGGRLPIAIAGTVQFAPAVAAAAAAFSASEKTDLRPAPVVPQSRPLSPGEVLGCTAPRLDEPKTRGEAGKRGAAGGSEAGEVEADRDDGEVENSVDAIVFVADGRFHMEALMIANPTVPAFRYDPYSRVLTRERYDHRGMREARKGAIAKASREKKWGFVLGTLGRQGSKEVLDALLEAARSRGKEACVVLISELSPAKLAALTRGRGGGENSFDPPRAWAQVACPRLSIDWGEGFGGMPVLTPYEAMVALGRERGWWSREKDERGAERGGGGGGCCGGGCGSDGSAPSPSSPSIDLEGDPQGGHYPMDYYSSSGGAWAGTHHRAKPTRGRRSVPRPLSPPASAGAATSSTAAPPPAPPVAPVS